MIPSNRRILKLTVCSFFDGINCCFNAFFPNIFRIITVCSWMLFVFLIKLLLTVNENGEIKYNMDRVKRIWYLSPKRAAKVQASLRIRAVSPEPSLLAHTSSESRGTFRQKARSLAPLNGWACAVKICHDGMLEDTNSLDGAHMKNDTVIVKSFQFRDKARTCLEIKYLEHQK